MEIETKMLEKDGIQMAVTAQVYREKLKAAVLPGVLPHLTIS